MSALTWIAFVLFLLGAFPLALLVSSRQRWGPEGPVGAHMITGLLALLVTVGLLLGIAGGVADGIGAPSPALYSGLPGLFVGLTIAAILPGASRNRALARTAVLSALAGGACLATAPAFGAPGRPLAIAGLVPLGAMAAFGYGLLLALWIQRLRNETRQLAADADRQSAFEQRQAAFQVAEWQKLPKEPGLWQLIQFTHSFDPQVRFACRARIAALPDLTERMQELLATGWASHALRYLAEAYPISTAPLAEPLSKFLLDEVGKWRRELDPRSNPGSWYGNLLGPIDAAERVAKDGGDVRAAMAAWSELLRGLRGLEPLAARARSMAA